MNGKKAMNDETHMIVLITGMIICITEQLGSVDGNEVIKSLLQ